MIYRVFFTRIYDLTYQLRFQNKSVTKQFKNASYVISFDVGAKKWKPPINTSYNVQAQ